MQLVELLIYAFASTGLTLLLDFSFEKNHIFSFWLPFVSKLLNFKHYREIKKTNPIYLNDYNYWYKLGQSNYLFYPLGFCVFCTSVWISFAFYSITHLSNWNFFEMFLMSFLSFGFIYSILASKQ